MVDKAFHQQSARFISTVFNLLFFSEFLQLQDAEDSLREKEAKLKESEEEHGNDLENSLIQLEQEQQRFLFLLKNEIISLERSVLA